LPRSAPAARPQDGYVYTLLVLDPGVPSHTLAAALNAGKAWQRYVRRGVHTLTKEQYQLMYVLDEVAGPQQREALKVVRAAEVVRSSSSSQ